LPIIATGLSKNEGARAKQSMTAARMFISNWPWPMEKRSFLAGIVFAQRMIGDAGRSGLTVSPLGRSRKER
jgi:hypothetical protein